MMILFSSYSEYEVELQALSGVRKELEKVSSEKSVLEKKLCNLEESFKALETLRNSQEAELQAMKVKGLPLNTGVLNAGVHSFGDHDLFKWI